MIDHGIACSVPVGTITSGLSPIGPASGRTTSSSSRATAWSVAPSAARREALDVVACARRRRPKRRASSSARTSAAWPSSCRRVRPSGNRHGVQHPVDFEVRNQRAIAEKRRELGVRAGSGRRRGDPGRATGPVPDRPLEHRLPRPELAGISPVEYGLLQLRPDTPELRQLGCQLGVVGRPHRTQPQCRSPPLLRPGERPAWVRILESESEARLCELLCLAADLRPQLGRAENGPVVVHQPSARPQGGVRPPSIAVGDSDECRCMLRPHAEVDRIAGAHANTGEGTRRGPRLPESEGDACAQQARVESSDRPARFAERVGCTMRGPQAGCRRPMLEERRPERRVSRKGSPARTALTGEAPRRSLRLRPCRLAIALQKCGLGEHEPSLGGLGDHLPFRQAGDRLFCGRARLGDETDRQEQLAAVAQLVRPLRERDASGVSALVGAVEVVERSRDIAAPAGDPAEVVLDLGQCEIELELGIEAGGREQIALRSAQRTAIPVHQSSVVERPSLPEPIAGTAEDRRGTRGSRRAPRRAGSGGAGESRAEAGAARPADHAEPPNRRGRSRGTRPRSFPCTGGRGRGSCAPRPHGRRAAPSRRSAPRAEADERPSPRPSARAPRDRVPARPGISPRRRLRHSRLPTRSPRAPSPGWEPPLRARSPAPPGHATQGRTSQDHRSRVSRTVTVDESAGPRAQRAAGPATGANSSVSSASPFM